MEYLPGYQTESSVKDRSQQEAWLRGCQNQPNDVTNYWQGWIAHPVRVEFALVFSTEVELAALKSQSEMDDDDWFLEA